MYSVLSALQKNKKKPADVKHDCLYGESTFEVYKLHQFHFVFDFSLHLLTSSLRVAEFSSLRSVHGYDKWN